MGGILPHETAWGNENSAPSNYLAEEVSAGVRRTVSEELFDLALDRCIADVFFCRTAIRVNRERSGIAVTLNILATGPVKPPSRYCGQVISFDGRSLFHFCSSESRLTRQITSGCPRNFFCNILDVRHRFAARLTPRGPKIHQHFTLPAQVVHGNPPAVGGGDGERRRHSGAGQLPGARCSATPAADRIIDFILTRIVRTVLSPASSCSSVARALLFHREVLRRHIGKR